MSWRVLVEFNTDYLADLRKRGEVGIDLANKIEALIVGRPTATDPGMRQVVAYHHSTRGTITLRAAGGSVTEASL